MPHPLRIFPVFCLDRNDLPLCAPTQHLILTPFRANGTLHCGWVWGPIFVTPLGFELYEIGDNVFILVSIESSTVPVSSWEAFPLLSLPGQLKILNLKNLF